MKNVIKLPWDNGENLSKKELADRFSQHRDGTVKLSPHLKEHMEKLKEKLKRK